MFYYVIKPIVSNIDVNAVQIHIIPFTPTSTLPRSRIAHNPYYSGWNNFVKFSEQRSDVFNLTEGEDYLLVGEFQEGGGEDYIQVGVLPCSTCSN